MNIIVDYFPSAKCRKCHYTCLKCGKCGREFDDDGIMVKESDEEDET